MDKTKRNVAALGALTVVGVAVFFWGLYFLLGSTLARGGMEVVVKMAEGGGLKRGDRVTYQGVILGSVSDIELLEAGRGVAATLRLNQKLDLTTDTKATITGDVFGAHNIQIVPGHSGTRLEKNDTIIAEVAPALTDAAVGLTTTAKSVLSRADSVLSYEAIANLHATARTLPGSAEQLRATLVELRQASAALRSSAQELRAAKTGAAINSASIALNAAIARIDQGALSFTTAANSLNTSIGSLQSVFTKIDRGQGTLGRLVNDTSLYAELNGAAREFRALAVDIKANPKKYVDLKLF